MSENLRDKFKSGVVRYATDHPNIPNILRKSIEVMADRPKVNIEGVEHLHSVRDQLKGEEIKTAFYVAPIHVNTWNWMVDVRRVIDPHLMVWEKDISGKAVRALPHHWPTSAKFDIEPNPAINRELNRLDKDGLSQKMNDTVDGLVFGRLASAHGVTRHPVYQTYLIDLFQDQEAIQAAEEQNQKSRSEFTSNLKRGGIGAVYGTGTRDATGGLTRLDRIDILWRRSQADRVIVVAQLDTHKIQPRDARGLDRLNPFQRLHVVVFPPQTPGQLQEKARNFEWTDNAIDEFGWTKRQEQRFTASDAIMVPVARLDLPVRVAGVDPKGIFQEGKYFVPTKGLRKMR